MADEDADGTWEKKGAEAQRDVMMAETVGQIEIEMGAAAADD